MLSDYQKVCEFNKSFDFPQYDNFDDKKCLKLRLDLIEEEIKELIVAYENNDYVEEQDACADILYVAYGMAYTYKVDSDRYLNYLIKDNNQSLFNNIKNNQVESKSKLNLIEHINRQFKKLTECCDINTEWINTLHNIIIYVYDFQVVSNYDSDRVFTIVHDSNMSKLCKSEEEAKLTVEKYESDFKSGRSPYDTPYYYPLDNGLYVVKNKSSGKALKSINYVKVKLD